MLQECEATVATLKAVLDQLRGSGLDSLVSTAHVELEGQERQQRTMSKLLLTLRPRCAEIPKDGA